MDDPCRADRVVLIGPDSVKLWSFALTIWRIGFTQQDAGELSENA
ncbi:hypothetical protein J2S36_001218 [Arcanobacterium hippocoleae]|uniref:Uncharacterized protein n=1 Tax=Arcanobacterium hippocoleae TaxID=149017 RepID=A0ABU1T4B1_9ACTO|nr:hypothetical protein [Arcanobacterium hippocoleae]MDR6939675.1 hypothetical protein [Arcanobacterium hippocoleae]